MSDHTQSGPPPKPKRRPSAATLVIAPLPEAKPVDAQPAPQIPAAAQPDVPPPPAAPIHMPPPGSYLPYPVWLVPAPYPTPQSKDGLNSDPTAGQMMGQMMGQMPPPTAFQTAAYSPATRGQMPLTAEQQRLQNMLLVAIIAAVALSHLPWFGYLMTVYGCFGTFIDMCFAAPDLALDQLPDLGAAAGAAADLAADPDAVLDLDSLDEGAAEAGDLPATSPVTSPVTGTADLDANLAEDSAADGALSVPTFMFARIVLWILSVQASITTEWTQFAQVLQIGTGIGGFFLTKIVAARGKIAQTQRVRWTMLGACIVAFGKLFLAQAHLTSDVIYPDLGADTALGYIDSTLPQGFLGAGEVKARLLQYLQTLRLIDALIIGAALAMPKLEG